MLNYWEKIPKNMHMFKRSLQAFQTRNQHKICFFYNKNKVPDWVLMFQDDPRSAKWFHRVLNEDQFSFLKNFCFFSGGWFQKVFFCIVLISLFLVVNIVSNMNLFIWNRSDNWHAHNQRLKISLSFESFSWKITSCKHQPQLFQ